MAKARSTLAAVLLLVWMATPALRCLVPGEALTAAEQACCKAMGEECGDSGATDHPCCKHVSSPAQPALAVAQANVFPDAPIVATISPEGHSLSEQEFARDWLVDPSPPPSVHRASSVLRI